MKDKTKTINQSQLKRILSKGLSEKEIQAGILAYLWFLGFPAFHVPNHGKFDPVSKTYRVVDKKEHVKGVPDLVVPIKDGVTIYFEVKSATGKVTDDQKKFHAKLKGRGHKFAVVRSLADVKECLVSWNIIDR